MAIQFELSRYDLTSLGLNLSGDGLLPKEGIMFVRRKGATVILAAAGSGTETIFVSDVGTIVPGDSIQANGQGATALVNSAGTTRNTLNVTWSGSTSVPVGVRLTLASPDVDVYSDPLQETVVLPQPITFVATDGLLQVYSRTPEVDFIRTIDEITTVIPDQAGLGGRIGFSPLDYDAKVNGISDDSTAFGDSTTLLQLRGGGLLVLPPGTAALGSDMAVTNLSGAVIRGQGKSITTLEFSTASTKVALSGCTDVTFENMTIGRDQAGSVPLLSITSGCVRTTFRNVHFRDGDSICLDSGTDTRFENCSADGASWVGGFSFLNATRPKVLDFVGRIANNSTTAFVIIDQNTASPRFTNVDLAPSAVGSFSFPCVLIRSTGGVNTGPTDVVFSGTKLVAGNVGTAQTCVEVQASASGDEPTGVTFRDTQCEDSERAFDFVGGLSVTVDGLRSVQMDEECIYLRAGVQHVTIDNIETSHIGLNLAHIRVDGAVGDLSIDNVKAGNYLRSGGVSALSVVHIEDGAGERLWITKCQRAASGDASQVVRNDRGFSGTIRADIHVYHNQESAPTPTTPIHEGFRPSVRIYAGGETTISAEAVGVITLAYGAGVTILTMTEGGAGQRVTITNVGANSITLKHQNTGGGTDFNFSDPVADKVLAVDESIVVELSSKAAQGWMEISNPAVV